MTKPARSPILGFAPARFIFVVAAAPVLAACGLATKQPWYEIALAVYSVAALMLLAEGRRAGPAFGMFYCLGYGALFFSKGVYGLAFFNALFGFPVYLFSLIAWGRHQSEGGGAVAMKRLGGRGWALSLGAFLAAFIGIYLLLRRFGSEGPLFDSLSLGFVAPGLVLLLLRYVENWCFNLAGNFVVLLLWIANTMKDMANFNFVLIAALAVAVNAIGFFTWMRLEKKGKTAAGTPTAT